MSKGPSSKPKEAPKKLSEQIKEAERELKLLQTELLDTKSKIEGARKEEARREKQINELNSRIQTIELKLTDTHRANSRIAQNNKRIWKKELNHLKLQRQEKKWYKNIATEKRIVYQGRQSTLQYEIAALKKEIATLKEKQKKQK